MRSNRVRWLAMLSVGIGGGSLVLFPVFLIIGTPWPVAIVDSEAARLGVDALLCGAFFLQHSGMIRRRAKQRLARRIPAAYLPALYSIASGVVLFGLVLAWQPSTLFLFHLPDPARWLSAAVALGAIAGFAWGVTSLGGFDPFGIQPLTAGRGGAAPASSALVVRGPFRHVRHPLYLSMLVLIWSTPRFTADQCLFNVLWTAWIVVGTRLEERDLVADFGAAYRQYQAAVPMLLPSPCALRRRARPRAAA